MTMSFIPERRNDDQSLRLKILYRMTFDLINLVTSNYSLQINKAMKFTFIMKF